MARAFASTCPALSLAKLIFGAGRDPDRPGEKRWGIRPEADYRALIVVSGTLA